MRKISGVFATIVFYIIFFGVSLRYHCTIYPVAILCCAVPHELGHVLAGFLCGCRISAVSLSPAGAVITLGNPPASRLKASVISLSGAAVNLLLSGALAIACELSGAAVLCELAAYELVCGVFNLLPVKPLDGWCALELFAVGGMRLPLEILSGVSMAVLFVAASYCVLFLVPNFSLLLAVFCLFCAAYLRN